MNKLMIFAILIGCVVSQAKNTNAIVSDDPFVGTHNLYESKNETDEFEDGKLSISREEDGTYRISAEIIGFDGSKCMIREKKALRIDGNMFQNDLRNSQLISRFKDIDDQKACEITITEKETEKDPISSLSGKYLTLSYKYCARYCMIGNKVGGAAKLRGTFQK